MGAISLSAPNTARFSSEQRTLLTTRIPDRLFELHLCSELIAILDARQDGPATLQICGGNYEINPSRVLLHASVDAAIVMCRDLVNFLGIKREQGDLAEFRPARTDPSIEWFTGNFVSVHDATHGWTTLNPTAARALLLRIMTTASQGVAHMKIDPARDHGLADIKDACDFVLALVNRELYEKIGESHVTFKPGGYGHIRKL